MDYIDIPATYIAKGWLSGETGDVENNAEKLINDAISQHVKYIAESWRFTAKVYAKDTLTGPYEDSILVVI